MNNRQKAKHFKKLYEQTLQKPFPVIYQTIPLQHCKVKQRVDKWHFEMYEEDRLRKMAIKELTRKLEPLVNNVVTEYTNYEMQYTEYTLDIWVRG